MLPSPKFPLLPDGHLILVALDNELPLPKLLATDPNGRRAIIGVGKINAAYHTLKAITELKPRLLINFGTAGALSDGLGEFVEVGRVVHRDIDLRPMGFPLGTTPYDPISGVLELTGTGVTCGSGDDFVDSPPELPCDIVDMELYAIAKVAAKESVALRAFKYISDRADDSASVDWKESLTKAADCFLSRLPHLSLRSHR